MSKLFLIWAGLVLGVSFLATPAKFLAPDLDLPTALQVGRVTFRVLAYAEAALLLFAVGLTLKHFRSLSRPFLWLSVLAILLLGQYLVILPAVAQHTDAVMAGAVSRGSSHMHQVYVGVELAKVAFLLWLGIKKPFETTKAE